MVPGRLGLIGFGGVARIVAAKVGVASGHRLDVCGILVRPSTIETLRDCGAEAPLVGNLDALLATGPAIVAECAGHEAVASYGPAILQRGCDLVLISIGALADARVESALLRAAKQGGGRLIFCPGAVGAIDALGAARLAGLTTVHYRGVKPPVAWRGTPAQDLIDLDRLTVATSFYRGNAREASLLYPKNSNVAATIALAGLGFERTIVELIADPGATGNRHELDVESAIGQFHIDLTGSPLPNHPATSALTAYAMLRTIANAVVATVI